MIILFPGMPMDEAIPGKEGYPALLALQRCFIWLDCLFADPDVD